MNPIFIYPFDEFYVTPVDAPVNDVQISTRPKSLGYIWLYNKHMTARKFIKLQDSADAGVDAGPLTHSPIVVEPLNFLTLVIPDGMRFHKGIYVKAYNDEAFAGAAADSKMLITAYYGTRR